MVHPISGLECARCKQPIAKRLYWCGRCKSRFCPSCYHAFCPACKNPVKGPYLIQG